MHIISRKPLREFSEKHPPAKTPLDTWFAEVNRAKWSSFADIRGAYGSAEGRMVYEPDHPLADAKGYVRYPDIDPVVQQANAMLAMRSYDANLAAIDATKSMIEASLRILG